MFKTELTKQQLTKRNLVVKELIAAGWDSRGWEQLFEGGSNLSPEVQLEYQNVNSNLRLSYYMGHGYLLLECTSRNDFRTIRTRFYPKENLKVIVDRIIEVQDTLSIDNSHMLIETMIPYCTCIMLETAKGFVKVS